MTADEFWEWCCRPENAGRRAELVRGVVVEMPGVDEAHGVVCWRVGALFGLHASRQGRGRGLLNNVGLLVEEGPDTVRRPDFLFFNEAGPLDSFGHKYVRRVPHLVAEVVSGADKISGVIRRTSEYIRRGVPLVWALCPADRAAVVLEPGGHPRVLGEKDELTGEEVLPGLKFRVAEFFNLPGEVAA